MEACFPEEPIEAMAKDLIVLKGGLPYDEFVPAAGESFGTIKFGEECFFGKEVSVTGSFVAKESNGKFETPEVTHLFAEASGLGELSFGGFAMTIDGSVKALLIGGHVGMKWSGVPG